VLRKRQIKTQKVLIMDKPKLENFKREINDGQDYADMYKEYYQALEKYISFLESEKLNGEFVDRQPESN